MKLSVAARNFFGFIGMVLFAVAVSRTPGIPPDPVKADRSKPVQPISESIHVTRRDGVKSLARLIKEQSAIEIPNQPLALAQFTIDAGHDVLTFPRNDFQPEGFELSIKAGDDKTFRFPRLPVNAPEALDAFLIKTDGACNFVVYIEFYP